MNEELLDYFIEQLDIERIFLRAEVTTYKLQVRDGFIIRDKKLEQIFKQELNAINEVYYFILTQQDLTI